VSYFKTNNTFHFLVELCKGYMVLKQTDNNVGKKIVTACLRYYPSTHILATKKNSTHLE